MAGSHNPEQRRAQLAVARAVRSGERPPVQTQSCSDCGKPARHYHHDQGYDALHALCVVPLCAGCHRRRHPERVHSPHQVQASLAPLARGPKFRASQTFYLRISAELNEQLDQWASDTGYSKVEICRLMLEQAIKTPPDPLARLADARRRLREMVS